MILQAILTSSQNFGNAFTAANTKPTPSLLLFFSNTSVGFHPSKVILSAYEWEEHKLSFSGVSFVFLFFFLKNIREMLSSAIWTKIFAVSVVKINPLSSTNEW